MGGDDPYHQVDYLFPGFIHDHDIHIPLGYNLIFKATEMLFSINSVLTSKLVIVPPIKPPSNPSGLDS